MNFSKDQLQQIVICAASGCAAAWIMERYQVLTQNFFTPPQMDSRSEKEPPATTQLVAKISKALKAGAPSARQKKVYSELVHYAVGTTSGAIFGWMKSQKNPVVTNGLAFGTGLWVINDNVLVPSLGLTKPPTQFPLRTHAYALSSHLVYGISLQLISKALESAFLQKRPRLKLVQSTH